MAASSNNKTQPTISSSGVVEYFDLASKRPVSWTPFTARGRMVINFKRIPHTTTWLSFPDIAASHIANNIPPNFSNPFFGHKYTIPALCHRAPGQPDLALQDSLPVALYLEKAFPDSPSIFPEPGALAFAQLVDHILITRVFPASLKMLLPKIPAILDERGAEYFRGTREEWFGIPLDQICTDPETHWSELEKELAIFSDVLTGPAESPRRQQDLFLMGDKPSYADILLWSASYRGSSALMRKTGRGPLGWARMVYSEGCGIAVNNGFERLLDWGEANCHTYGVVTYLCFLLKQHLFCWKLI